MRESETHNHHIKIPLLQNQCKDFHHLTRTGNLWTAVAHITTGVIGSGVLSLSWSMAHLGWVVGPTAVVSLALTTLLSAFLLSDASNHSPSYVHAVRTNLGTNKAFFCAVLLQASLYGYGIAYTVTSGISMRSIRESKFFHGATFHMLIFGAVQMLLSQIPDFHNIQWLSVVASLMSFTYALVALGLGVANVIRNGYAKGSVSGISTLNASDKVWFISQALGDIAFSYPFSLILFEIQDTLKSPPPESETMKRASTISILITTFFYLFCGGFGYAAFGDATPGNLMAAFGANDPYLLVDLANACIVLHLVGGYQIYSQPLFASVENWLAEKFPDSEFITKNYTLKTIAFGEFRVNLLRLCFRTGYVVTTTTIAILFPYFNQILGVLGGFIFWPMTIYFPVEMYLRQKNIEPWTTKWVYLRIFSSVFLFVALFAFVGSIQGLISAKLS